MSVFFLFFGRKDLMIWRFVVLWSLHNGKCFYEYNFEMFEYNMTSESNLIISFIPQSTRCRSSLSHIAVRPQPSSDIIESFNQLASHDDHHSQHCTKQHSNNNPSPVRTTFLLVRDACWIQASSTRRELDTLSFGRVSDVIDHCFDKGACELVVVYEKGLQRGKNMHDAGVVDVVQEIVF